MSTSRATDRKKTLNSSANSSTTNAPPNVDRSSPISVSVAISDATTPANARGIAIHLWAGDRKASTTSTRTIVPARISSGRIAV